MAKHSDTIGMDYSPNGTNGSGKLTIGGQRNSSVAKMSCYRQLCCPRRRRVAYSDARSWTVWRDELDWSKQFEFVKLSHEIAGERGVRPCAVRSDSWY